MPQPAPAIPQIPAGWQPVQADFTAWVTNPFSFLAKPAVFRGELHASVALAAGFNLMQLDTIGEDPYGGWSAVLTGSQPAFSWLCPAGCPGWYEATLSGFTTNQGTNTAQVVTALYLNGAVWQYGSDDWALNGGNSGSSGAVQVPLLPGDYVQLYVFSSVGTAVNTPAVAGQFPSLELSWTSS